MILNIFRAWATFFLIINYIFKILVINNNNSVVISVVPSTPNITTHDNLHVHANSNPTSAVSYTQYITNEPQISLKRELVPSSSLVASPQQPPAIKIQKLPLNHNSNQLFLNCPSLPSKKSNETGHVQIQAISQNSSASFVTNNNQREVDHEESQKMPNVLILPSSDCHAQSSIPVFDQNSSSQKLKNISQLNEALTAINPRYTLRYLK